MSNNSEQPTEGEPLHARLYLEGEVREWLIAMAREDETSVSKVATKLIKQAHKSVTTNG